MIAKILNAGKKLRVVGRVGVGVDNVDVETATCWGVVVLNALGVGVVIEARHLCMMMRGVEKQHSSTITSAMLGAFREKETRDEFLALIHARHSTF